MIAAGVLTFDEDSSYGGFIAGMTFGSVMVIGGAVGMGYSAKRLRDTKRQMELDSAGGDVPLRSLPEAERDAQHGEPGRVRWDHAQSRLVF